jgi:hypothetical protein
MGSARVAHIGRRRIYDFGGKGRMKETTRKTESRWEDNIKIDLK